MGFGNGALVSLHRIGKKLQIALASNAGVFCRSDPAAALRGLAKIFFPSFSCAALSVKIMPIHIHFAAHLEIAGGDPGCFGRLATA